ncbi:hypothetical protein Bca52824_029473 [Brassica carinata]|uniref:Uncharacterized protein n=1 Tax=Brassica carinata TaxID=52824 RepID=A0A8X7VE19_BRACI|nr:hypothetical protein Bca52824_029473 [Brassica carinata]
MALEAIKALNGLFTMRGSDQPLIVRFADPKKPRLGEPSHPNALPEDQNTESSECDWSEHTCPDGNKYYFHCVTGGSGKQ